MFKAFVDDSASDEGERTLLLAGLVQRASVWSAFSDEWEEELNRRPRIDHLHMVEAESLRGQFEGWGDEQRNRKLASLANVLCKYDPWFLECRVSRKLVQEITEPVVPHDLRGPYFPCFYGVILKLAHWHLSMGNTLPIDFVFDEQGPIGAEAVFWYEVIKSLQPEPLRNLLGSTPTFSDDKKVLPLQAADFLAWHLRRRTEERNQHEKREVMQIFLGLLHAEVVITEEVLRREAKQMAAVPGIGLTRGKQGSVRPILKDWWSRFRTRGPK